ncbi:hypothetical protein Aab01nite_72480 [Paractinoplanes abujensis]|uniref:Tetratricopeptide (TPR) repeat protein n=1 Tax=Paractinoplanes abujensis TaxID=882441 RepID=A0A7W7G269_9ACTN|nr:hypothetical protein [Actinoplanes abujensis]MBB4694928.1 tetratricopeptide (TPR) repeat protein [Actinoplanes abujensis]GID23658.1 hypothetical protein Aab01nite_72480 [Actinoplanes abujensis]
MTAADAELERMLAEAHEHGHGPAYFAALDTVFRHADATGRTEFAYRARMNALHDMHYAGEYARAFMTFSWLLATFDRHPELTTSYDEHTLLWRFKWIVWELSQFSGIPLDKTKALLDDMQRRYQAGSHSLHAVHQHRAMMATHLGDLEAAGQWFEQMAAARRDSLSDCQACVPTTEVEYLVARGEYEEAVRVGSPYAFGGCTEQPQQILSHLLLAYLHTGRTAEAVRAHKSAYQRIRDSRHYLELIALNVQFCGLTGNQEYGLTLVERHLPWLDRPASPYAAMEFASAAALVLRRLIDEGAGDTPVRRATGNGARRWQSTAAETHADLVTLARSLAADFDRRNGNSHQSGRVEARLAAAPLADHLPLTVLAGLPISAHPGKPAVDELVGKVADLTAAGDEAGAAQARLDAAYALRNAAQWGDALETAEEARRSLDRAGLTDAALEARWLLIELNRRTGQRPEARRAVIDELLAAPRLPASLPPRAVLLEETAYPSDGQRAADQLFEAAALHRAAGDAEAEARTLTKALGSGTTVPADLDELVSRVDALDAVHAQDDLCRLLKLAGRPEDALARALRHAETDSELVLTAAELLLELGRPAEAEETARRLLDDEDLDWDAAVLVARSLRARGEDAAAFMEEHHLDDGDLQ